MDSFVFFLGKYWELIATCVFSVISTILISRRFQKSIKPIYTTLSSKVFKESEIAKQNKITILYKDNVVKTLTITKLAFWNSGKQTLKYKDHIAEKDPFRIVLDNEGEILDYELLYQKEANDIKPVLRDNRIIYIPFNYFTHNEGFVLKIYHTGKTGEQIKMCGSMSEDAKIKHVVGFGNRIVRLPFGIKISKNVLNRITGLVCVFIAIFFLFLPTSNFIPHLLSDNFAVFLVVILFVSYMLLGILFFKDSFQVNIPKIMRDKFFDE